MFSHMLRWFFILLVCLLSAAVIAREMLFEYVNRPSSVLLPPKSSVIDMHIHTAGLGYGGSGCFISDDMKNSYKFDYYLKAFGVSRKEMEDEGDQVVIQQIAKTVEAAEKVHGAVVLAMDGVINEKGELDKEETQVFIPNDYVAKETAKYPSLYFGASINPYRKDSLAQLEKVKRQGARLIKWIPNIQLIDPADKKIIPFYKKMKELNLPLLSHTGQERSFNSAIDEYADPKKLELPLSLGVTVIAAHIATTGEIEEESNFQRIMPLFSKYSNLYADISSLTQINKLGYLRKAIKNPILTGRLIYGSDYPLVNMILVSAYYFPLNLTFEEMSEISSIDNPLDRDVALKQALGVPSSVFVDGAKLLRI